VGDARGAAGAAAARVVEMVVGARVEAVWAAAAVVEMERAVVEMERVVAARVVAMVAAAMEAVISEAAVRAAVVTGSAVTGWAVAVAWALVRAAVGVPTLAGRRGAERGYEEGDSSLTEALTGRCRPLAGDTKRSDKSMAVVRSPIERSGRCCSTQRVSKSVPSWAPAFETKVQAQPHPSVSTYLT
jgi:hypothetical protein